MPVPSVAELSSSATATATMGVIAVAPAPPPVASVCMVWMPMAVSVRLLAPVSAAPLSMDVVLVSWP